jgi:hypothetical protein
MSSSNKLTCKGALRLVFICLRPRTPYSPPYTLYTCIQYTYSHREGGGGAGDLKQREGGRGNSSQSWVENTNMTNCISSL